MSSTGYAQLKLPSFFSDHMILQQNETVTLFGKDKPNMSISIRASWGAESATKVKSDSTWSVALQTIQASFDAHTVTVRGSQTIVLNNVLLGEVWLCSGQSNMEMEVKGRGNSPVIGSNEIILNATNQHIRLFNSERNASVQPLDDALGTWEVATPKSVKEFSAIGYLFGKKLHDHLNVPVGIIEASWGGTRIETWIPRDVISKFDHVKMIDTLPKEMNKRKQASFLFNAMIHPFLNFTIKGVLWYQGETNRTNPEPYEALMKTLITTWREGWNQPNLPFYFVQIAPYDYTVRNTPDINAALIREAQLNTAKKLNNVGMVVTSDVGDCNDIHPAEKKIIADRLSYWALAQQYDFVGVEYINPLYQSMKVEQHSIRIRFDDYTSKSGNGLTSFGQEISGFTIAGSDKKFYPAKASINKDRTITVHSVEVAQPVAVRYHFKSCYTGNLFSIAGLPVSPFRTDNW